MSRMALFCFCGKFIDYNVKLLSLRWPCRDISIWNNLGMTWDVWFCLYPRWAWCCRAAVAAGSGLWGGCPGRSGWPLPHVAGTGECLVAATTRTCRGEIRQVRDACSFVCVWMCGGSEAVFRTREWVQCRGWKRGASPPSPETLRPSPATQTTSRPLNPTGRPPWIWGERAAIKNTYQYLE